MKRYTNKLWGALLPLLMAGCNADTAWDGTDAARGTAIRLLAQSSSGASSEQEELQLNDVRAYRFADGTLQEVFGPMTPEKDGLCYLNLGTGDGTLYVLVNASQVDGIDGLEPGVATLDEFKALPATTAAMTGQGMLMSGQAELSGTSVAELSVGLKRSVARLDLESTDKGVEVLQVNIANLADRGYIYEQTGMKSPETAEKVSFKKDFDTPLANGRETLLYLCEQPGEGRQAEVLVRFRGALHRMTATLPGSIRRNTTYTLHAYGQGDDVCLDLTADGWENGNTTDTETVSKALVNTTASTLPNGVRVNERADSVFIPYQGSDFRLVLNGEAGTTVRIDGQADGVTIQTASVRSLQPVAAVTVRAEQRLPGSVWEYIHLDLYREQTLTGRVVLACEPNPVTIEGELVLDENGVCDFGRYVEGELGRLTVPEGKLASVEADAGETPWIKLVESDGYYRVLGGWKPNDPKADGRTQEARLIISDTSGSNRESYAIRRINWGLPVVEIDGTWWCKYNLRGNVNKFEDQISIEYDQTMNQPLAEHLASCTNEELQTLMGGQFQGGNPDELPLRHDGSVFYHEGFKNNPQSWNGMPATQMAPPGYEVPDYDDYAFFGWGTNSNIGGVGTRTYQNTQGKEITVTVTERQAIFCEQVYGTVAFYDFEYDGNHWTLFGLGHQWNSTAGNISRMMIMLATAGTTSNSWYMEGYSQSEKEGQNWLKYTVQNTQKTRTIRCIKTPVEYTYN